jgi:hypothetical protein
MHCEIAYSSWTLPVAAAAGATSIVLSIVPNLLWMYCEKGSGIGTQADHFKIAGRHSGYEFRGSRNYATAAKDQKRSTRWQSSSSSPTGL